MIRTPLEEFTGQAPIIKRLVETLLFSSREDQPLPHVMLFGSPGLGKSLIAELYADAGAREMITLTPPFKPAAIDTAMMNLEGWGIIFLDEVHAMSRKDQDQLLITLEKREVMVHTTAIAMPEISFMAATTDPQMVGRPFLERFGVVETLEPYPHDDMIEVAQQMFEERVDVDEEHLEALAYASGGIPRRMRHLADEYWRQVVMGEVDIAETIRRCRLTPSGFTMDEVAYMRQLASAAAVSIATGVGEANLRAALGYSRQDLLELEQRLIAQGLVVRTRSGRSLTALGHTEARKITQSVAV